MESNQAISSEPEICPARISLPNKVVLAVSVAGLTGIVLYKLAHPATFTNEPDVATYFSETDPDFPDLQYSPLTENL